MKQKKKGMEKELTIQDTQIILPRCRITQNGMGLVFDEKISHRDLLDIGKKLKTFDGAVQFWIGDWINANWGKYSHGRYDEAVELGYNKNTLQNCSVVSRKIPKTVRFNQLPFEHHKLVTKLSPDGQSFWLKYAIGNNLSVDDLKSAIRKAEIDEEVSKRLKDYKPLDSVDLRVGDFKEECEDIPDNCVDLILTDPPYFKEHLHLLDDIGRVSSRVLKPSGFLIIYYGSIYLDRLIKSITKHLNYYWIMCLQYTGASRLFYARNMRAKWLPMVVFQKPPYKNLERIMDDIVVGSGKEKDYHDWQKSVEELYPVIETFTKPNDLILDLFAGAGTTLIASVKLKRRCIGIDIEPDNIKVIKARLSDV